MVARALDDGVNVCCLSIEDKMLRDKEGRIAPPPLCMQGMGHCVVFVYQRVELPGRCMAVSKDAERLPTGTSKLSTDALGELGARAARWWQADLLGVFF